MELKIKQEEAQALVNYLQEQPFKDVAGLIQMLIKLQPVEENKPVEEKVK